MQQYKTPNKAHILREAIRRQYIQSYQKKIRNNYQRRQQQQLNTNNNSSNNNGTSNINNDGNSKYGKYNNNNKYYQQQGSSLYKLSCNQNNWNVILNTINGMLKMSNQEICGYGNLQYMIDVLHKCNIGTDNSIGNNNTNNNNIVGYYHNGRDSNNDNNGSYSNNNNIGNNANNLLLKQKIPSIIYRILDKLITTVYYHQQYQNQTHNTNININTFNNKNSYNNNKNNSQTSTIIINLQFQELSSKLLHLLTFPQLIPLWQKISLISTAQIKQYYCQHFIKFLLNQNKQSIFNANFVIDVIFNFIVNQPEIRYGMAMRLMGYVRYQLQLMKEKYQKNKSNQDRRQSYEDNMKVNKICMIIRAILRDNGSEKMRQMIQQGYQSIFIILLGWLKNNNSSNSHSIKQSNTQQCYQNDKQQLFSTVIMTKISFLKLINRLFTVNLDTARYLYSKCSAFIFRSLLAQLKVDIKCRQQSKYKYIVCKSHEIFIRYLLIAIHAIINIKTSTATTQNRPQHIQQQHQINPLKDFILSNGLQYLHILLKLQHNNQYLILTMKKQLTNIIYALDSSELYWNMNKNQYLEIMEIIKEMVVMMLEVEYNDKYYYNQDRKDSNQYKREYEQQQQQYYEQQYEQQRNNNLYISNSNNSNYNNNNIQNNNNNKNKQNIQLLTKLLKIIKNTLLGAYTRATQPQIFIELTQIIIENKNKLQMISILASNKNNHRNNQSNYHDISSWFNNVNNSNNSNNSSINNNDGYYECMKNTLQQIMKICDNPTQYIIRNSNNNNRQ